MEFHRSTSASRQSRLSSHLNATDVSRGAITSDGRLLTRTGLYRAAAAAPSPVSSNPSGHPVSRRTARVGEREKERHRWREGTNEQNEGERKRRYQPTPTGAEFSSPCKRPTVSVCVRFAVGCGGENVNVGGEPPRHIVNCPMETVVAQGRTSTDLQEYERSNYRSRPRLRLTILGQKPAHSDLAFLRDEDANIFAFFRSIQKRIIYRLIIE